MAIIIGSSNDEQLVGTSASDEIRGLDGNDTLDGSSGPDLLAGGFGNDTYVYRPGSGFDTVSEVDGSGFDTIQLLSVMPAQVQLVRVANDLVIQFLGSSDQIMVTGYFDPTTPNAMVERITFTDGTVWDVEAIVNRVASNNVNVATEQGDTLTGTTAAETMYGFGGNDTISGDIGNDQIFGGTGNDSLFGNGGSDQLYGEEGNDILRGSGGNDVLQGGTGDDLYTFAPGHGNDLIIEAGGVDRIYLGSTYAPNAQLYDPHSVNLIRSGNNLVLDSPFGTITVQDHFAPSVPNSAIEEIVFEDGTIWDASAIQSRLSANNYNQLGFGDDVFLGSAGSEFIPGMDGNDTLSGGEGDDQLSGDNGNDRLFGNQGNDTLSGGYGDDSLWGNAGSDTLDGGAGNDTYYFNLGDGHDVIIDSVSAQAGNRLVFGAGISRNDLSFRQDLNDLVIEIAGSSDSVRLVNSAAPGVTGVRAVETLQFADGSSLSLSQPGTTIEGSDYGDWLVGGEGNDRIYGYGGDDWLQGMAGSDTLIGGAGYDQLDGSAGNDTYVFNTGDGFDQIWEGSGMPGPVGAEAGGHDTVQLATGYEPAMTMLERWGNDLVIRNGQTGDQIVVREHFGNNLDGNTRAAVEQITFADGSIWNTEAINNRLASMNHNWTTEAGDTVGGSAWNDYLYGMGGNDTLSGGQGDDTLDGETGNDRLFGGDGNDVLIGQDGNDLLAGGDGNDFLNGGIGNDVYFFNIGNGVDRIDDMPIVPGETNRIVFGDGIRFSDVHAYADYSIGGVTIEIGSMGDRLQLAGSVPDPYGPHAVSTFQFADGTVVTYDSVVGYGFYQQGAEFNDYLTGSWYADSLYGNAGDDQIYGDNGNDILAGGQGVDWLSGGQGDDSYYFNRGDGSDFIDDVAMSPYEGNRVVFGEGITTEDVLLRTDGWTSWLDIAPVAGGAPASGIDSLRFSNFSPFDSQAPRTVASFEFADGSVLTVDELIARGFYVGGTESRDHLYGTDLAERFYGYGDNDEIQAAGGNDTLIGGSGNDILAGGAGDDTYLFNLGDGVDIIDDLASPGEGNRVVFGAGITADDLHLVNDGMTAHLDIGSPGNELFFTKFSSFDPEAPHSVETFEFADGSTMSYAELLARGFFIGGTEWSDTLVGSAGNDVIYGYGEGDLLVAGDGNDTLVGGTGNDQLQGGAGHDTYLFNLGDGTDFIFDAVLPNEGNRVVFGAGIDPYDLSLRLEGSTLHVRIGPYNDQLSFENFDRVNPDGQHAIDTFEFADGSTLSFTDLLASRYIEITGTGWDDVIEGTYANDYIYANTGNDVVYGYGGDDQLWGDYSGQVGDDILDGGEGNDYLAGAGGNNLLIGGLGNDTFQVESTGTVVVEYANEGIDDVLSTVDYSLTANVENLRLAGYVISGTGNDLANDIYGNSAANILDGGAGIDRLYGFSGNDTYIVDNASDQVVEYAGGGTDTVISSATYLLAANVENLVLTGIAAINGTGNALANVMTGNSADNMLFGGSGADTLQGGAGVDSLLGGLGGDTYVYNLGDGNDSVFELEAAAGDVDKAVFGGGITAQGLVVTRIGANGYDLQIAFAGSSETLTLWNWFNPSVPGQIEEFHFADGSVMSGTQLADLVNYAPTVAQPLVDQMVLEDTVLSLTLPVDAFADIDNDVLSFSATLADGSALPNWISFDSSTRTFSGTPGNAEVGSLDIRVTATDPLGESASDTFSLTVQNVNDAPVASQPLANQAVNEDGTFLYTVPADAFQDLDAGDSLAFSASLADGSPLPLWLNFDAATRSFSSSLGDGTAGDFTLRVIATDSTGASVSNDFVLSVADSLATVQNGTASADTLQGTAFMDVLNGLDGDDILHGGSGNDVLNGGAGNDTLWGEDGNDTLVGGTGVVDVLYGSYGSDTYVFNLGDGQDIIVDTYANAGDADTLRFGAGITRDMLDISHSNLNPGNVYADLAGNDGINLYGWYYSPTYRIENLEFADGTSMTAAEIQAWADNVAPVVATPAATQTATEDAPFNFTLPATTFSDANAGDVLSYAATLADGSALPGWLQFDAATQTFTGTPANDQVGTLSLSVTATDGYGKSATTTFDLDVQNSNDAPTVANMIADQLVDEDATFSFTVPADTFGDVDVGDNLAYGATLADGSDLPSWLSFDAATRTFSGTPANGDVGTVNVNVIAADSSGVSVMDEFALTIANTNDAPVVASAVADQTGDEGSAFNYTIPANAFSDIDAGDSLAYTATLADGSVLPAWLDFDTATRTFSGNPADGTAGSYSLRVTATDSAGASVFDDFVFTVADAIATVQNGNSSANTLYGTAFMDALNGFGGNDTLYGYAGNDTLNGGSGSDRMYGGSGDDTYVVNSSSDTVTENANEGTDTVQSSITYTLGNNVENLTLTGSSALNATGNSLDNVLIGNSANNTLTGYAGNDWLDGGAGSDTMRGGSGNDTYVVSTSGDVVTENSNEGTDTVRTSISYTLGSNVENLSLTGSGNAAGTGNSLNNIITGNNASNTLTGNGGNDTLQGLGGNDILRGGTGNDTYIFGRGDGADTISENDSTTGIQDTASLGVNALDVVFARSGSNLVMSLHDGAETLTVQSWYSGSQYQTEVIQAADGMTLLNTQVDQLIQAMATFSANNGGISWDQAIAQNPNEVQAVLTAYWQPAA